MRRKTAKVIILIFLLLWIIIITFCIYSLNQSKEYQKLHFNNLWFTSMGLLLIMVTTIYCIEKRGIKP